MRKLLQLKMYSFLASRWGMTFCVVGLFVTLSTFFQLAQLIIKTESFGDPASSLYSVNVGGRQMQHIMCADPIDIVYTWVNGSDPKHKKAVADYKRLIRDPKVKACNSTQTPEKDLCYKDEDTASRFVDNEELRYSLRSIEKFAPWVRQVFLVTNGQVPSWINIEHPRLTIVTHEQIFTNKSHLPTFSSPSIEVHLHRIPGLSNKFIYLNDDVMFGRDVYPDDFYTLHGGQRVFLSWAVPNCAEGCPPNWVGDGYCDLACNVSSCDFDAHDCDNYTGPASRTGSNTNNRWWGGAGNAGGNADNSQRYKNYCAKGCPDSWIGDKYCDRMCKNLDCAYDAGDCGVEDIFGTMHGVQITMDTNKISLPSGISSVYFNLSSIVGSATITDGSHDNVELVRTATISQKFKIMTLTFHRNISMQEVMLSIIAENTTDSGNKTTIEKSFNITLDTIVHPTNETLNITSDSKPASQINPRRRLDHSSADPGISQPTVRNLHPDGSSISRSDTTGDSDTKQNLIGHNSGGVVATDQLNLAPEVERLDPTTDDNYVAALAGPDKVEPEKLVTKAPELGVQTESPNKMQTKEVNEQKPQMDPQHIQAKQTLDNESQHRPEARQPQQDHYDDDDTQNDQNDHDTSQSDGDQKESRKPEKKYDQNKSKNDTQESQNSREQMANKREVQPEQQLEAGGERQSSIRTESHSDEENEDVTLRQRDVLSIPIYDDVDDTKSNYIPPLRSVIPPANSVEYQKWWDAMSEKKRLDVQQMEDSKQELAKLESKTRQNRNTEKYVAQSELIRFPWEEREWAMYEMKGGGRKLLDDFADSLKHVNKLYTQAFGPSARKVPAHMPHMIDKHIMEELQQRWPYEWNETSSHRLRSNKDMQYAFAYFYYLIHAKVEYNITNIWETELDVDGDDVLNDNELRTLGVHLYGAPLKQPSLVELRERLLNVCYALHSEVRSLTYLDDVSVEEDDTNSYSHQSETPCPITLMVLQRDNKTSEEIKKVFSKKLKYRHQIDGTDEVAFLMIGNNDTVVQSKLDGIRTKRQKFICLNDNMNHSSSDTGAVVRVLHDLYTAILPLPSSFELPPNIRNAYLYIDDVLAAKAEAQRARQYSILVGTLAILAIIVLVYRCRKFAISNDRRVRERRAKRLLNSGGIS